MKGVVFTEFLEMVEAGSAWKPRTASSSPPLASSGADAAVGTYDHNELVEPR